MRSSLARCWCCCTALLTRFEPFKRPTAPGATERLCDAFRADAEEQKHRGASISSVRFVRSGDPEPPETEETVRI